MMRAASDEGIFHSRNLSEREQRERLKEYAFRNRPEGYQILVYQLRKAIVGYVDYQVKRGVGQILGIYVKQNLRSKGLGKKLMQKVLDDLEKKGCHKARLEVFAHNHGAIGFYQHEGFVQEGFLRKDEEKRDIAIMSKFLSRHQIQY
jgi:ribosomal protein S18 acetylase RimI-like enzyme